MFANHLPRISVLLGTVTVQVVCVGGGRTRPAFDLFYTLMCFFVAIQAGRHIDGVICGISGGNGI